MCNKVKVKSKGKVKSKIKIVASSTGDSNTLPVILPDVFPVIRSSTKTGIVVLFSSNTTGTVVVESPLSTYPVGYTSREWHNCYSSSWAVLPAGTKVTLTVKGE